MDVLSFRTIVGGLDPNPVNSGNPLIFRHRDYLLAKPHHPIAVNIVCEHTANQFRILLCLLAQLVMGVCLLFWNSVNNF